MRARPSITIFLGAAVLAVGPIGVAAAAAAASPSKPAAPKPAAAPQRGPVAPIPAPTARVMAAQAVPTTVPPPPPNPNDPNDYVDPIEDGHVISSFGWRSGRRHQGVDYKGPYRGTVFAAFGGTVLQAGPGLSGYGYSVTLDHGDGVTTLYAHLASWSVKRGDVITQNTPIGTEGQTGNASTPHVHYEVRVDGVPRDPATYLSSE